MEKLELFKNRIWHRNRNRNNAYLEDLNQVVEKVNEGAESFAALIDGLQNSVDGLEVSLAELEQRVDDIEADKIIETTYDELVVLQTAGEMVEGAYYRINDFQQYYNAFDDDELFTDTLQGAIEPLIVLALSPSQLSYRAYSESHPGDIIFYKLTPDTIGNEYYPDVTKGVIYYRKDTILNNEAHFDFRSVTIRMWNTTADPYPGGPAVAARNTIVFTEIPADGDTFTIDDTMGGVWVFEFDDGGGVAPGNIAIPLPVAPQDLAWLMAHVAMIVDGNVWTSSFIYEGRVEFVWSAPGAGGNLVTAVTSFPEAVWLTPTFTGGVDSVPVGSFPGDIWQDPNGLYYMCFREILTDDYPSDRPDYFLHYLNHNTTYLSFASVNATHMGLTVVNPADYQDRLVFESDGSCTSISLLGFPPNGLYFSRMFITDSINIKTALFNYNNIITNSQNIKILDANTISLQLCISIDIIRSGNVHMYDSGYNNNIRSNFVFVNYTSYVNVSDCSLILGANCSTAYIRLSHNISLYGSNDLVMMYDWGAFLDTVANCEIKNSSFMFLSHSDNSEFNMCNAVTLESITDTVMQNVSNSALHRVEKTMMNAIFTSVMGNVFYCDIVSDGVLNMTIFDVTNMSLRGATYDYALIDFSLATHKSQVYLKTVFNGNRIWFVDPATELLDTAAIND